MPLNLETENIELLWLIQPNLQDQQLEIKKKFDKPVVSIEVNDLMYITISSDFDYIYKLNPFSSAYRGNTTFFVFKVNSSSQTVQDFLLLKLNEDIESSKLDSFMSYLMDYTDLLDLESASLKNETLRKIFEQFKRKEICTFNKNESSNKQDVLNSLNFHHNVYVDKSKADMITNGGQAVGDGIVSLAKMASNLIETIGTQITATNSEPPQQQRTGDQAMSTDSAGSSSSSESTENEQTNEKSSPSKRSSGHSKRHHHHRHGRHSRKHKRDYEDKNDDNDQEDSSSRRHSRRHRRHGRRAANLRRLNEFTRSFSQTASIAASAISSVITETTSYVVPAVEEYLPGVISKVTNYDEETSRRMVGSTLGYGSVALSAVGNLKNSVSEGLGIVGSSITNQTSQVVKSKYGDEAGEQAKDVLETGTNMAKTYTTIKNCNKLI